MKTLRIIIIAFIILTVGSFVWFTSGIEPESFLLEQMQHIEQHQVYFVLVILLLTILSTLAGLPVFYFGMALGFLMPFLPAMLMAWGINLLAVIATFYMVRLAFYTYFKKKYGEKKMIRSINRRIKKYGIWPVVFSRSIYIIPTNIINFSFPISKISARQYVWGTAIGLVPEVLLNVITGYLIKHEVILLTSDERQTWQILVIAGFLVFFTLLFVFLRLRQKRIKEFSRLKEIVPMEE